MDSLHFKSVDKSDIRGMEPIPIFEEENTDRSKSDSWHILIFLEQSIKSIKGMSPPPFVRSFLSNMHTAYGINGGTHTNNYMIDNDNN